MGHFEGIEIHSLIAELSTPQEQKALWGANLILILTFNYSGNTLRPKLFSPHNTQGFGAPHNVLPPSFSNDHSDRGPRLSPMLLEPIPESSPNDLEHIQAGEVEDSTEVLAVDNKPLEVAVEDGYG